MQPKTASFLLGVLLLVLVSGLPGAICAGELPQKPAEATAIADLRHSTEVYNQAWIERAHRIYKIRHRGSLEPVYIYLVLGITILLALCIRLGAKMNGLDRHLRTFADHQFKTALRLWMVRRWGARI